MERHPSGCRALEVSSERIGGEIFNRLIYKPLIFVLGVLMFVVGTIKDGAGNL